MIKYNYRLKLFKQLCLPGDFVMKEKHIDSQSDLISMSNLAGLSYLTIRSSAYIILIRDLCIFNLKNLCQTGYINIRQKVHQCAFHFISFQCTNKKKHFLQLQPSIWPLPTQNTFLSKGPPKLCIQCHLVTP